MKKFFTTLLLATLLFNMSNPSIINNKENDITKNTQKEVLIKSKQYKIKSLEGFLGW
ncbi:hypothetical protein [Streptococcus sp. 11273D007BW]